MTGKGFLAGIVVCVLLGGCRSNTNGVAQETPTSGTIHISVDESFKPVIDSEIKVFESSFPNCHIIADYEPEAQCLRDLTTDSTRLIFVTRGLTKEEGDFYQDSFHVRPLFGVLAYDAVAVVVNNTSKDSIFSIRDLQDMLGGNDTRHQPVMDGVTATSTVRYAMDSILRGKPLGKGVMGVRGGEAVVDYVAGNPRAVGFVGASWIGDRSDPADTTFSRKVTVAAVQCVSCLGPTNVRPYQGNIALRRYPLVQSLYYILKENFSGVGNNFVNFLQYERGQLVFSKSYMWPANMNFQIRDVQISQ
jgi:phosphate transport system substrate-binding protein